MLQTSCFKLTDVKGSLYHDDLDSTGHLALTDAVVSRISDIFEEEDLRVLYSEEVDRKGRNYSKQTTFRFEMGSAYPTSGRFERNVISIAWLVVKKESPTGAFSMFPDSLWLLSLKPQIVEAVLHYRTSTLTITQSRRLVVKASISFDTKLHLGLMWIYLCGLKTISDAPGSRIRSICPFAFLTDFLDLKWIF